MACDFVTVDTVQPGRSMNALADSLPPDRMRRHLHDRQLLVSGPFRGIEQRTLPALVVTTFERQADGPVGVVEGEASHFPLATFVHGTRFAEAPSAGQGRTSPPVTTWVSPQAPLLPPFSRSSPLPALPAAHLLVPQTKQDLCLVSRVFRPMVRKLRGMHTPRMTNARVLTFHIDPGSEEELVQALDEEAAKLAQCPGFGGLLCLNQDGHREQIVVISL